MNMYQSDEKVVSKSDFLLKNLEEDRRFSLNDLSKLCQQENIHAHLAILNKPYLEKIINGIKTIESRFSKVRQPPFRLVECGDILFLKQTAGDIIATALVKQVNFFGPFAQGGALTIMDKYQEGLALGEDFRTLKAESRYATLMHLTEVKRNKPIKVEKSDRRPWVILNNEYHAVLF